MCRRGFSPSSERMASTNTQTGTKTGTETTTTTKSTPTCSSTTLSTQAFNGLGDEAKNSEPRQHGPKSLFISQHRRCQVRVHKQGKIDEEFWWTDAKENELRLHREKGVEEEVKDEDGNCSRRWGCCWSWRLLCLSEVSGLGKGIPSVMVYPSGYVLRLRDLSRQVRNRCMQGRYELFYQWLYLSHPR